MKDKLLEELKNGSPEFITVLTGWSFSIREQGNIRRLWT